MKQVQSILFVCLGNICRSPLAEGIARNLDQQHELNLILDSAGTGAWHIGKSPCPDSIKVGRLHHIDISGLRARQVRREDHDNFDLIVAMDESNYRDLLSLGFSEEKVRKLGTFGWRGEDVPDPYYYSDFEGFERVYTMIDQCVRNLYQECFGVISKENG